MGMNGTSKRESLPEHAYALRKHGTRVNMAPEN